MAGEEAIGRAPTGSSVTALQGGRRRRCCTGQRGGRAAGGRAAGRPGTGVARDAAQRRLRHAPPAAAHRAARGSGALPCTLQRDSVISSVGIVLQLINV